MMYFLSLEHLITVNFNSIRKSEKCRILSYVFHFFLLAFLHFFPISDIIICVVFDYFMRRKKMEPEVYTIYLPIYKAPTHRLQEELDELMSSIIVSPAFLMQIAPDRGRIQFIPSCGDAGTVSIPMNFVMKDLNSKSEFKRLSSFCSKFNLLASFSTMPKATKKTNFLLEMSDPNEMFDGAIKMFVLTFKVSDLAIKITIDNLFNVIG